MTDIIQGKVKDFFKKKGYGFITIKGENRDIFFHISDTSVESINTGENVEFSITKGDKGKLKAINVCIVEDEIKKFLKDNVLYLHNVDYDKFCEYTFKYAEELKKGKLTTSMIRKIYSRIMNADNTLELKMLRPQFAYTAGRNDDKAGVKNFMDLLDYLVKSIENENQLKDLKRFMEAVVAYRKYVGDDK